MRKISSLFIIISLSMTIFLCPNTQATLIDRTFYTQVTSVDNPLFWGWNVGDYIPGHITYDDSTIPDSGNFIITGSENTAPEDVPYEFQNFDLSIDFGNGRTISRLDELDPGFPWLRFLDGELSGFDWRASELNDIDYFNYSGNSLLARGGYDIGDGGVLRGNLTSDPAPAPVPPGPVPEPSTILLLSTGLIVFFLMNRGKKRHMIIRNA